MSDAMLQAGIICDQGILIVLDVRFWLVSRRRRAVLLLFNLLW